jgi:hypothetical protein
MKRGRHSWAFAMVSVALSAFPVGVIGTADANRTQLRISARVSLASFEHPWYGHDRVLNVNHHGIGKESVSGGCCDRLFALRLRLTHPRGTSDNATVKARVLSVHWYDRSGWSGPTPHVGEVRRLRLRDGVLYERITGTTYCTRAADYRGACGA